MSYYLSANILKLIYVPLHAELEITNDPQTNANIKHGEDVTLTVSAVGPQPLSYKWTKDGKAISDANCNGADKDKLTITSFSSANQGCYLCTVNGDEQYVESMPALLGLGTHFYINFMCYILLDILLYVLNRSANIGSTRNQDLM